MLGHEIIKKLRIAKNLTQRELAEKFGLTQQAIALIEAGKRKLEFDLFVEMMNYLDNLEPQSITSSTIMDENPEKGRMFYEIIRYKTGETVKVSNKLRMHELHDLYLKLNDSGQEKLLEHAQMLTKIPEYRKDTN